jgi:hypothetical protein
MPARPRFPARRRIQRGLLLAVLAALLAPARPSGALTLDWDIVDWTSTATRTETYTVGSGSVTLTVDDPNGVIVGGVDPLGSPGSIVDTDFLDPTGNGGAQNLFLKTDGNTSADWVSVTIDFSSYVGGVTDVSISLFDVDALDFFGFGFTDQIIVTGTDGTSTFYPTVTADSATPSWTWNGTDTITGNAYTADSGAGSEDGTAIIFFSDVLTSITLTYQNTLSGGQSQWIGFSAIDFREVPEPSTGLLLGAGLLGLGVWRRRAGT